MTGPWGRQSFQISHRIRQKGSAAAYKALLVTMQAELRRLSDDGCVCAQPNRIFGWWTVRLPV